MIHLGTPADAGLDPGRLEDVETLLDEGIREGAFPGSVALIARGGVVGWHVVRGDAQIRPSRRRASLDTIYDLASLTKVLAALPVSLALSARGVFALDAAIVSVLPEFTGDGRDRVTFRQLLAHTSGLPSWKALYLTARSREAVLPEICRTPLQAAPGAVVEYSDLGVLLLGFALERLGGRRIDALVEEVVIRPLELRETMYAPPGGLRDRCAATEAGHAYEREKVGEAGRGFSWREDVLRGEVHDGNCYYAMGGIAPHAGLFSTAWEVAMIAHQWLRPGPLVDAAAAAEATSDQRAGADGYPRGLGWVLHHQDTFFEALGPRSFGHTGFTGTSVAVDPDEDLLIVLLTNRVHLGGANTKIQDFRLRFHETARRAVAP